MGAGKGKTVVCPLLFLLFFILTNATKVAFIAVSFVVFAHHRHDSCIFTATMRLYAVIANCDGWVLVVRSICGQITPNLATFH